MIVFIERYVCVSFEYKLFGYSHPKFTKDHIDILFNIFNEVEYILPA